MMTETLFMAGAMVLFLVLVGWMSINLYKRCPPNTAMLISGMLAGENSRQFKIVVGGGAVALPMIQQVKYLSLELMNIDVKAKSPMISADNIPLFVSGTAQVKVKGDDVSIATAAEQLLDKKSEEVAAIAEQVIIGSLRQIVASLTVAEVIKQHELVMLKVQEYAVAELAKMGLCIVTLSITEVRDEVGYLDLLAREEVQRKRQQIESLKS